MDLSPWDLWAADGKPQPATESIVATLEEMLTLASGRPLGSMLLLENRLHEAEEVCRAALRMLPENGWPLWELARTLERRGRKDGGAIVEARVRKVWSDADIQINSSCLCLPVK